MKFLTSMWLAMAGMFITMQTIVAESPRQEYLLETGWMFTHGDVKDAVRVPYPEQIEKRGY